MKTILCGQLTHAEVEPILERHGYTLPANVDRRRLDRWHFGPYYDRGAKGLWVPLNSIGGIATKAFHSHTVKFPKLIDNALQGLLEAQE